MNDDDRPPSIPDLSFWLVIHIAFSLWSFGLGDIFPFIVRWVTFIIFFTYNLPARLHPEYCDFSNWFVRTLLCPLYGLSIGFVVGLVGGGIGLAGHMLGFDLSFLNVFGNNFYAYCLTMLYLGAIVQAFRDPFGAELDLEGFLESAGPSVGAGVATSMMDMPNSNHSNQTPSHQPYSPSRQAPSHSTGHNPTRRMPHAICGAVICGFDGHFFQYHMKCDRCGNQHGSRTSQPACEDRFGFGSEIATAFHCQRCGNNQQVRIKT